MNILVTGNLGYNGPILVQQLRERGHFVVGLDTGFFMDCNFMPLRKYLPDVQVLKDIRKLEQTDIGRFGIEKVVHLAALSNDPLGELSPEQTIQINSAATEKLFKIASGLGAAHFVYASSCSTYGKMPEGSRAGEGTPIEPLTAYAKSKAMSEKFLAGQEGSKTKVTVMRYSTMFGASPMLRLDLVVNNLVAHSMLYGSASILSDGTPWRPILHLQDFAAITQKILMDGVSGTFNVGFNSMNYQIKEIGAEVSRLTGAPLSINPQKTPDERSYVVDFSKIEGIAGPAPLFGLPKGISELSSAYRQYGLTKDDFESGKYARAKTLKRMVDGRIISSELLFQ